MLERRLSEAPSPPRSTSVETSSASTIIATRAGFVDPESPAFQIFTVKPGDCGLGFGAVGHFHKSESPRIPGELVSDDLGRRHLSEGLKGLSQIVFGGLSR